MYHHSSPSSLTYFDGGITGAFVSSAVILWTAADLLVSTAYSY